MLMFLNSVTLSTWLIHTNHCACATLGMRGYSMILRSSSLLLCLHFTLARSFTGPAIFPRILFSRQTDLEIFWKKISVEGKQPALWTKLALGVGGVGDHPGPWSGARGVLHTTLPIYFPIFLPPHAPMHMYPHPPTHTPYRHPTHTALWLGGGAGGRPWVGTRGALKYNFAQGAIFPKAGSACEFQLQQLTLDWVKNNWKRVL